VFEQSIWEYVSREVVGYGVVVGGGVVDYLCRVSQGSSLCLRCNLGQRSPWYRDGTMRSLYS
jgi:hypothetical protein